MQCLPSCVPEPKAIGLQQYCNSVLHPFPNGFGLVWHDTILRKLMLTGIDSITHIVVRTYLPCVVFSIFPTYRWSWVILFPFKHLTVELVPVFFSQYLNKVPWKQNLTFSDFTGQQFWDLAKALLILGWKYFTTFKHYDCTICLLKVLTECIPSCAEYSDVIEETRCNYLPTW